MNKIKKFCKDHKKEIIITGMVVGTILAVKHVKHVKNLENIVHHYRARYAGKSTIAWVPNHPGHTLEEVGSILAANAESECMFAVLKDGHLPYQVIHLNNSIVKVPGISS